MYFEELKKYLLRKHDRVVIEREDNYSISFTVTNKCFEKHFFVYYIDSFSPDLDSTKNLRQERPANKYYWMCFTQENYPQRQQFVSITDMSWYSSEECIIESVKRFCRNWRR